MPSITLEAHYDGERIRLDEAFEMPVNCRLLVTVLSVPEEEEHERGSWSELARDGLERAYGGDEPEYTEGMIKEPNRAYGRR